MSQEMITQQEYDELFADRQLKAARNHIQLFEVVAGAEFLTEYELVRDRTMVSLEALYDLYTSVRYINRASVPGAVVEVGTWKGGALALSMLADESLSRTFIGFDTFEGHLQPPADEVDVRGSSMLTRYHEVIAADGSWCKADFDECQSFLRTVSRGSQSLRLIKGDVKSLLPQVAIEQIAILRIDVDWYLESITALNCLYEKVERGGIVVLDDYGHHSGQRRAFEEFFSTRHLKWTHVNYATVVAVKL